MTIDEWITGSSTSPSQMVPTRHSSFIIRHFWLSLVLAVLLPPWASAQKRWEFGGFLQQSATFYARRPNPSDTGALADSHFRLWTRMAFNDRVFWRATWDARLDTHRDADRRRWFDLTQRSLRRPAGALNEFYFDANLPYVDVRVGKQEIRWGRADGFNPTDNLIPYDYLDIFSEVRIPVPAVKADVYWREARIESVWIPFYTPTRLPLLNQRWFPRLPSAISVPPGSELPADPKLQYRDGSRHFPSRSFHNGQWGLRWNQLVPGGEFSLSYFDGFDDIAFFRTRSIPVAALQPSLTVILDREYHRVRVVGGDFASTVGPLGVRGEIAYFDQHDPANRDHLLFVVGLDRTWRDWFAIVQYVGQNLAGLPLSSTLFPELGLRSTMLLRVERTIGPSRSFEIKGALRLRDGDFMLQPLYKFAISNRWRLNLGVTLFAGDRSGFLGQYRDNGSLNLQLRYSF